MYEPKTKKKDNLIIKIVQFTTIKCVREYACDSFDDSKHWQSTKMSFLGKPEQKKKNKKNH